MRRTIVCLLVVLSWHTATAQDMELRDLDVSSWDCLTKPEGAAKTQDGKERNRGKNRTVRDLSGLKIDSLDTAAFLARAANFDQKIVAKHRRELSPQQKQQVETFEKDIVSLTGWLNIAYQGVPESTNCKSDQFVDWHLEVFAQPSDHPPKIGDPTPIVCEITPRTEQKVYRDGIRIQKLAAFVRQKDTTPVPTGVKAHKVRITGYLMWDDEHNNPTADVGSTIQSVGPNKYHHPWRSTAWEIHPVLKIESLDSETAAAPTEPDPPPTSTPAPKAKLTTPQASEESRKMFPDLGNANSALYKEVWARYQRYKESNPKFFDDPEWPIALAKESAEALGVAPASR